MKKHIKKSNKIIKIIIQHIKENIKSYLMISLILLVGIILGVIAINNIQEMEHQETQKYINNFMTELKNGSNIKNNQILRKSITNNLILVFFMWFVGSTVIGIPLVIGMVMFKGFSFGYTISSIVAILGVEKGTLFCMFSILLQNFIIFPCIMALAVSGIKLYKSIMKDRRKENIKIEIIRHTLFSILILATLMISSFIEAYISSNLIKEFVKII